MKEYIHFDGEKDITFNVVYKDDEKQLAVVASSSEGKISVLEYEIDVVITNGIETARSFANYHSQAINIAVVKTAKEARALAIHFGVYPVLSKDEAADFLEKLGLTAGDFVLEVSKSSTKLLEIK